MEKPPFKDKSPEISPAETAIFAAEIGEAPSLDLHGMDSHEAVHAVDAFLNREFMTNSEAVRIIHGRGTGTLRKAIHESLKKHPLVIEFRDSMQPGQQGGVTLVALERKQG